MTKTSFDGEFVVVDCVQTFHMQYVVKLAPGQTVEEALLVAQSDRAREFYQKDAGLTVSGQKTASGDEVVAMARAKNKFVHEWSDQDILDRIVTPGQEPSFNAGVARGPK